MPKRTVYVREADEDVWKRAEALAGNEESLSAIVTEALRQYVTKREIEKELTEDMETVELEVGGVNKGWRTIRFVGKEIAGDNSTQLYVGRSGRILAYFDLGTERWHEVFDDFDDVKRRNEEYFAEKGKHLFSPEILTEAAEALNDEYIEEIEL